MANLLVNQDYIHFSYNSKWYSPLGKQIENAVGRMIENAATVQPQGITFQKNDKDISFLNLSNQDLIDISSGLGKILNNSVRKSLVEGRLMIKENLSALSDTKVNKKQLDSFFKGISKTFYYIHAFRTSADKKAWGVFIRELKNSLINKKPFKLDIKQFKNINSAILKVMEDLSRLPQNVADNGGTYSKDSLRSFINNIIPTEIGEIGAGQHLQRVIEQQTGKELTTTLSHTGKITATSGITGRPVSQKADMVIDLCDSEVYSLSLRSVNNQDGFNLILSGQVGLSVKEYKDSAELGKDDFINIHSGGEYASALLRMSSGLNYTAIGNTLAFTNDEPAQKFRLLRSAFIARFLESALIGSKDKRAEIIAINGKYYLSSILYKAAIANIKARTQFQESWSNSKDNGVALKFNNLFSNYIQSSERKKVRVTKNRDQITAALERSRKDLEQMHKMTFRFEIAPETLIKKWIK